MNFSISMHASLYKIYAGNSFYIRPSNLSRTGKNCPKNLKLPHGCTFSRGLLFGRKWKCLKSTASASSPQTQGRDTFPRWGHFSSRKLEKIFNFPAPVRPPLHMSDLCRQLFLYQAIKYVKNWPQNLKLPPNMVVRSHIFQRSAFWQEAEVLKKYCFCFQPSDLGQGQFPR